LNYLDFFRSFLSFVLSEKRKTNMIPLMTARHPAKKGGCGYVDPDSIYALSWR
jgi:hypothetical protein